MTSDISIRLAGIDDVPAIKAITDAAYAKWIPVIGRPPAPMMSNHAANVIEHAVYLAVFEGKPVAVLDLITEGDCLFIDNLAVHPDHQAKGIAGKMLSHAETACRAAGLGTLRLLTNQKFESNIAYYAKRGFVHERQAPFMGGITEHMVKHLD